MFESWAWRRTVSYRASPTTRGGDAPLRGHCLRDTDAEFDGYRIIGVAQGHELAQQVGIEVTGRMRKLSQQARFHNARRR